MTRSARRRRLTLALLLALLLPVAVLLLAWAALRSPDVRHWVVARVAASVEQRTGLALAADDVVVSPLTGEITVTGLTAAATGSPPFLTVARLRALVDLGSLRGGPIRIETLAAEGVLVDTAAPLPELPAEPADGSERTTPALTIAAFSIRDGTVEVGPLPPALAARASCSPLRGIALSGSLADGRLVVDLTDARMEVRPAGEPALELVLTARAEARRDGRFEVRHARLAGRGLEIVAQAAGTTEPSLRATGTVHLDLEPDLVHPGMAAGGSVAADATFALPERTGSVRLTAERLRTAALRPLVDPSLWHAAALESTTVSASATGTFALPDRGEATAEGRAELTWFGPSPSAAAGEERRAAAAVELRVGHGARVTVDASLLPDGEGFRRLTGTATVADLSHPGDLRLGDVRAVLDLPDVGRAWEALRGRWPAAVPDLPAGAPARGPVRAEIRLSGDPADPEATAAATWEPSPGARVEVQGQGRPLRLQGTVTAELHDLDLAALRPGLSGRVSGRLQARGRPGAFTATADLEGGDLAAASDTPTVDAFSLRATTDGSAVTLTSLDARSGSRDLHASGRAVVGDPIRTATLHAEARAPGDGLDLVVADLELAGGTILARVHELRAAGMLAAAEVDLPLAALGDLTAGLPLETSAGPVRLAVFVPAADSCLLGRLLPALDRPERARGALSGELWIDVADPTASFGSLTLSGLEVTTPALSAHALAPLRLDLAHRRATLEPTGVEAGGTDVIVAAEATLAPGWAPDMPPEAAVASFSAALDASIGGATLTPYLAGGTADGGVDVTVTAAGTPASPTLSARVDGPGASFFWPTPYATTVEAPSAEASITADGDALLSATAVLNGGSLRLTASRAPAGPVEASLDLADVRYRLDLGLRALLGGTVDVLLAPDGSGSVTGRLVLERGVLDRPVDLQHDLLPRLLAPEAGVGTERNALDRIGLDVAVDTVAGVRVKNNLADLRVRWDRLEVRGTAWNPVLVGRLDIDPGGLLFALGQTVRIDRGSATFTGDPLTDPVLDLATTSSLEDPSLGGGAGGVTGTADAGLAAALAGRSAADPGSGGERRLTIRPVLVFGEADPSARLNVTRELSRSVALAVSVDLRQAQRQTYVLDIGRLRGLPTLAGQVFTNDRGHHGAIVQQTFELGGGRDRDEASTRLRRVVLEAPDDVPHRPLLRALGLRRDDPLPDGAAVDAELELVERLREMGWAEARVDAALAPVAGEPDRADLKVAVHPGVRVAFEFAGARPPSGSRDAVIALYRGGIWETEALAEMRRATVRVFRSLGYLDPDVAVSVAPASGGEPRRVIVHTAPGRRIGLDSVLFSGVAPDAAEALAARFAGAVDRVELAAGVADAVSRVEESLVALGYPRAHVAGLALAADGGTLEVRIEPGTRIRIASVTVTGVSPEDASALAEEVPVQAGDPARRDRIALAAVTVEDALRARGHADARVRPAVEPAADADTVAVRLEAAPGPSYRIAAVEVEGRRSTSRAFALRLTGLEPAELLDMDAVRRGRRALLATGLFGSAVPSVLRSPDGDALVTYRVQERPRFSVAYGLRWESGVGASAVLDAVDRNLAGRGLTLGLRAQYEPDDRSGRVYLGSPALLGSANDLEIYLLRRRRILPSFFTDLVDDSTEAAVQLSRALTPYVTARVYGRYRMEHLFEREPDPFFPLDTRITHPYVGVQLIVDSRDDQVLARRGTFASIDVSASDRALGSDFAYVRTFGQLNLYRPVGSLLGRDASWAQSVRVGIARARGQELLRDVRFFAGGEYSVRGYPTEGLGPREVLGDLSRPLGGEALLVVNEELRVLLPRDLVGVVFVDAGQVWTTTGAVDLSELAASAGVGVRAATPLGLIRLDAAVPFDRRPGDAAYALYLGFGSVF